ncbi:hypothetical protein Tco_1317732 [Tanacetum coccineum]
MESLNSNSQERELHELQQMQVKAKETLFDQDVQNFTCSMLRNLDQLEKQLDKEEFQETRSMDAFRVLKTQFQLFINFCYYFNDDEGLMIGKYFLVYTQTEGRKFRDTLIQHMESFKKSIDEREQHKREYDSMMNERHMQSKEGKVDSSKALDADLVVTESSGTELEKHDTNSRSGNDTHAEDANIKPVNDKELIAEITVLKTNTPYPSRKIRRIRACTHQRPRRKQVQYVVSSEDEYVVLEIYYVNILEDIKCGPYSKKPQYACMTSSSTNELFTPYKEHEREFQSSRRQFKTLSLDELRSPDFNLFYDQEYLEEEVAKTMAETMEQYMSKTRADYGSGVARPKIEDKDNFELKGQFLKNYVPTPLAVRSMKI